MYLGQNPRMREIAIGDWVETKGNELGIVTDIRWMAGHVILEVCVGRCYREMPCSMIGRVLPVRTSRAQN